MTGTDYAVDDVVAPNASVVFVGAGDHTHLPFTDSGLVESATYYYDAYAYDDDITTTRAAP